MDLLDTVAHLYENDTAQDGRRDSSILQTMGCYSCKNDFGQQEDCKVGHPTLEAYRCSHNNVPSDEGCPDNSIDVTAMVEHLNSVLRQRINTEIENFRVSVNEIVNDQQLNYQTMFGLQPDMDPSQEVPIQMYSRSSSADNIASDYQAVVENGKQMEQMSVVESPASTFNSYGASDGEQRYSGFGASDTQTRRDADNALADKYLIRLMTATLLVGNTLRRKEYKVL